MPIHDYSCKECDHEYEVFYTSQSAVEKEEHKEKCPKCLSPRKQKLVSKGTSFVLNGTGYYSTDNKRKLK